MVLQLHHYDDVHHDNLHIMQPDFFSHCHYYYGLNGGSHVEQMYQNAFYSKRTHYFDKI